MEVSEDDHWRRGAELAGTLQVVGGNRGSWGGADKEVMSKATQ